MTEPEPATSAQRPRLTFFFPAYNEEENIERTVHGSLFKPGEEVRLSWSPDHTFVVAAPNATEDAAPAMDTVAIQEEPIA